jgi:exopolyphosphatase/guanosine-5'-triphosphate,3'-diphosphate pyrophosphatase
MPAVAAIDLGSNAIRLAIGSLDRDNQLTLVDNFREAIRVGQDVFNSGVISDQTTERIADAFQHFRQIIDRHAVSKVRAVGTSAMREAVNRDSLIKRLREESGIKLEVIQGIEEAQLIAEAVLSKVDVRGKLALLIDIGGGSIEISLVDNGDLILSDSVKMGSVRLLQILEERGRSAKVFHRLVKDYANGLRRQLKRELGARKVVVCVGTGGNLEALADLKRTILRKDNTTSISRSELDQISETLQALTFKERVEKLGLRDDRADVIIPAAIVLQSILKYAEVEELRIPRVSLKDGLLLQLIRSTKPRSPEAYRRQVMAFARELGRRFNLEEPHA